MRRIPAPWQYEQAGNYLDLLGYRGDTTLTANEVWCVLDAAADGDDIVEALEEHRMWRTPAARREQSYYS